MARTAMEVALAELILRARLDKLSNDMDNARRMVDAKIENMQKMANAKLAKIQLGGAAGGKGGAFGAGLLGGAVGGALVAAFNSATDAAMKLSAAVFDGVVAGLTAAVTRAADFEQSIVDAAAAFDLMDKGTAAFSELEEAALSWGAKTKFSAKEVAEALAVFGQAGFSRSEGITALGPTLASAAANNVEVAQAAELATAMMRTYNKTAGDLAHINDVITTVNAETAASFGDLRYALQYAAPAGAAVNVSLEQVAGMIGMLSNIGIKGEMAGTVVRSLFSDLVKPTKAAQEVLDKYKISVENIAEPGRFMEVIRQLAQAGISLQEATKIFGVQQAAPLLKMFNSIDAEGRKGIDILDRLVSKMNSVENAGITERKAGFRQQTFMGDLEKMMGAVDALLISIGKPIGEALRPVMQHITTYIDVITDWAKRSADVLQKWAHQVVAIAGKVLQFLGYGISAATGTFREAMELGLMSPEDAVNGILDRLAESITGALDKIEMYVSDLGTTFELLSTEAEIGMRQALNAVKAFAISAMSILSEMGKASGKMLRESFDPRNWLDSERAAAAEQRIKAGLAKAISNIVDDSLERVSVEDKVLQSLRLQSAELANQLDIAQRLRNQARRPAPKDPENKQVNAMLGGVGVANLVGAGLGGMGGLVGALPGAGMAMGGLLKPAGGDPAANAMLGGIGVAGLIGAGPGGLAGALPGAAQALGGLMGPAVGAPPAGNPMGALGIALAGGGPAIEALIQGVAEGAEQGVAKGQTLGIREFRQSIQDSLFNQEQKNDWKELLTIEDKQLKENEKIREGVENLLKKPAFAIFGGKG